MINVNSHGRKWRRTAVATVVIGALLFGVWGAAAPQSAQAAGEAPTMDKNTIAVVGQGELEVTPDIAYVDIVTESKADTAAQAQKLNAAAFDKAKQGLLKYGITDPQVKTTNFSVNPVYKYSENSEPKVVGYEARHAVRVTYRDLEKLGNLVDTVTGADATRVQQIQFDIEKRDAFESEVLEKAVKHAASKAGVLAKAANRQFGPALAIVESGVDWQPMRVMSEKLSILNTSAAEAAGSAPQGGQVKLRAQVQVLFEMK
ncbi:SIMPL domain-containing protein [Paenibacillus popilliae]|uniref:Uncharacterized conserved protein n=1 Tax=Paenibacillus popilliae ATCC 14706 TaxID=1212764 RepID=M9LYL2_PAEPP|nr:SIMPL domain-containing protein [Paenibacillus popilliae]GAC41204.1 uncharacterized conserved protein [Paenibacillus popilliae ATCC 14706]